MLYTRHLVPRQVLTHPIHIPISYQVLTHPLYFMKLLQPTLVFHPSCIFSSANTMLAHPRKSALYATFLLVRTITCKYTHLNIRHNKYSALCESFEDLGLMHSKRDFQSYIFQKRRHTPITLARSPAGQQQRSVLRNRYLLSRSIHPFPPSTCSLNTLGLKRKRLAVTLLSASYLQCR